MSLAISSAFSDLQRETNTIGIRVEENDFFLFLNRANKYFNSLYKMPTTQREANLLVFPDVHEYAVASDFAGMMEPKRPYLINSPQFEHVSENEFTHFHSGKKTAFKWDRDTQFLIVNDDTGASTKIHTMDAVSDEGAWTISGDGSGLAKDEQIFTEGSASLRFTITGSGGTTTLVNSTFTALDLTDYEDIAYFFVELICPSGNTSALTNLRLRIGSSTNDYWQMTATTRHRGDNINAGGGLIGFDWSTATESGTPSITAVNYAQIVITHPTSNVNGVYRIDNLFVALPTYYILPYYSLYNVKATGGTYQENVTANTDTVLIPADFNLAYIYKTLELIAVHKLQDAGLANYAREQLIPQEMGLRAKYPSQERIAQTNYYKRANKF